VLLVYSSALPIGTVNYDVGNRKGMEDT